MTAPTDKRNKVMKPAHSMLVIARDGALIQGLDRVGDGAIHLTAEVGNLVALNGRVRQLASGKDMIVVQTDPHDMEEIAALHYLMRAKPAGTEIIALADENVSLADVQLLNDVGVERVLPVPANAEALALELTRLGNSRRAKRLEAPAAERRRGKIIATVPARGGIGATTLTVNLAERLAAPRGFGRRKAGARVALIDLDLQFGSVGSMLDLPEQDALARLAGEGTTPDSTFLSQAMLEHGPGLRVLPAPDTFVPADALNATQVAAMLDVLRAEFDFIVIDLPHAVARWIEPVVARADLLLLVADTSVPSVRQGRRLTDLLTADSPGVQLRVIASRETRPLFRTAGRREAERALERPYWAWLPADPKHARAAADQGRPISAIGGGLARAIQKLARQVERELEKPPAAVKGS